MIDNLTAQLNAEIAEQRERLGRAVTGIIAEYAASLGSRKVRSEATPAELEKIFDEPFPEQGIVLLSTYQQTPARRKASNRIVCSECCNKE